MHIKNLYSEPSGTSAKGNSISHIPSADAVNSENSAVVARIFEAIPKIAKQEGLEEGYRIITNIGEHGCQSVKHLHFHVLAGAELSEKMA